MAKWKMIGIRVPEESSLPARLKEMSEKTRLSYCELLEKLITQAELNLNTSEPGFDEKDIITLHALCDNLSDLRKQINEIRVRLQVLEEPSKQEEDTNPSQASETTVAASQKRAQESDRSDSGTTEGSELADPIAAIARPESTTKNAKQSDRTEIPEAIEMESGSKSESKEKAATINYIRRLSAEGLSLRKIAERLKSEEVPTLSGSGIWHHATVQKILASAQTS